MKVKGAFNAVPYPALASHLLSHPAASPSAHLQTRHERMIDCIYSDYRVYSPKEREVLVRWL